MTVHVVGNVCIDLTFQVERFPAPGETLVALSSRTGLGGKGANQAVAAARCGADVALYVAVGRDEAADLVRKVLGAEPMALHLVAEDGPTDSSIILVRGDGENLIVSDIGRARRFEPVAAAGLPGAVRRGDVLLLQGNLTLEATAACLRLGRETGAFVMLNPSPLSPGGDFDWPLVDLAIVNLGEVQSLTGEAHAEAGAAALLARGAGSVVVTLGRAGMLLAAAAAISGIAAPEVEAVDTAGAGDVLCGVAAGFIGQGLAVEAALARAAAAAALSVTRPGALNSCPTAAEMRALAPMPVSRQPIWRRPS